MAKFFVLVVFSVLMFMPVILQGEDLIVNPSDGGGYLNNVILGDTTANGDRVDLDRVYVLRRDGSYFVDFNILADGFDVRLRSEEGMGIRPVIYLTVNIGTGTFPGQIFLIDGEGGNIWLKDLILLGFIEAIPNEIQNIPSGLIRANAAGFDVVIDGCLLSEQRGQHIRTQSACRVVKITNSVLANMGDLGRSNLGAGKGVDFRDGSCDTALFRNNTFVNFQDRVVRHRASTAAINHFIFDHNTVINGGSYHGTIALGWVGDEVTITNNLFFDPFIFGNDSDASRQAEFDESGELDEYGFGAMNWIFTIPNDSTSFSVRNNYYGISDAVQTLYNNYVSEGLTGEGEPLTHHIKEKIGADSSTAFIKETLNLVNIPDPMTNMVEWYRTPASQGGAGKTKSTTNFIREQHDFDRRPWEYFDQTFDASYQQTAQAFTGADGGLPAGDLNWWEGVVGIEDPDILVADDFRLEQNYPNPFNPTTTIEYLLSSAGNVKLYVYSVTGQKVATLVDDKMPAGSHRVVWDARNVASGVYFYKLQADNFSSTRKMILMK